MPPAKPIRRSQLCHRQEPWLPGCHSNWGQRVLSNNDGWGRIKKRRRRKKNIQPKVSRHTHTCMHTLAYRPTVSITSTWVQMVLGWLPCSIWDSTIYFRERGEMGLSSSNGELSARRTTGIIHGLCPPWWKWPIVPWAHTHWVSFLFLMCKAHN